MLVVKPVDLTELVELVKMGDLGEMSEFVNLGNLGVLIILLEMPANLKLVVLKSVDLSVVDWWMSENWGNVCEFRVECEVNEGGM